MEGSSRTPSWQKNGNRSSPSTDSISSSDTMMDCAESLDATLSPSPINTDSGGPSDKHRTTSASTPRPPITGISSVDVPHDSAHHSGHVTPDIQRDNQQSAQNRMAIDFILNSSPPNLEDSPEPSVTKKNSTAQVPSSVTSASAGRTLENLNNLLANYQRQISIYQKMIGDIAAGGSDTIPADRSIKLSISYIGELNAANSRLVETVNSAIHNASNRYTHIVQQQEKAAEAGRKAKKSPLKFIAEGTKSTVYEIPESFGRLVLKVGPLAAIDRERLNILRLAQAYRMNHAIWHDLEKGWLTPLLVPKVGKAVPTGWVRDVSTGLLKPSENLDPRIPGFYDAMGDRIPVDSDEQAGLVLSRIGDLKDTAREAILWISYKIEGAKLKEILDENDHCLIRIYLGKQSDGDTADDAASDDEPLSTLNLPGCLDHIIRACGESKRAKRRVLSTCAREIAFGYALLHWGARLDGRGIEFLLGASPSGFGMRLYMLDYEDCRPISDMNAECVRDQLVPAALENDPYIPRPTVDRRHMHQLQEGYGESFWLHEPTNIEDKVSLLFSRYYLEASDKIWAASAQDFDRRLPMLFIHELATAFLTQDAEGNEDGPANQYVTSEDGSPGSAQEASSSQEAPEHYGDNQNDRSQAELEPYDNDQHGDDGNGPDAIDSDDSSEGEEGSDEDDDDDYDHVD